jgi:phosphate transport system substrate-binding protein
VRNPSTRRWRVLIPLLTISLVAAACGGDDSGASGDQASGSVIVSGSSTVEPISSLVAERLVDVNDGVDVTVDGPGTGDGFKLFCSGETDISNASRAIKEEEAAACEAEGIEFIELKIGIDGLSVLTSTENEDVTCLSFADLYALVGPESQGFDKWSKAAALAKELGSNTTFPDADLAITAPGEESGTYDSFIELALKGIAEDRGKPADQTRPDYQSSADDNLIIQGIEGSPSSLGWVGFAFAEEAGDGVREIEVAKEPNGTCVAPSADTIASGEYPLSRPLYIYVNAAKADENPALAAYVDFYLSDDGITSVEEAGYIAVDAEVFDATRARWDQRTVGTEAS